MAQTHSPLNKTGREIIFTWLAWVVFMRIHQDGSPRRDRHAAY